jgi:predicted transcriptional regulator
MKQASKTLKDAGYTWEKVAYILGISRATAIRYASDISNEQMAEFDSFLKRFITLREGSIADKTLELIEQKMDRAKFGELVNLYRTIRTDDRPQSQINIAGGEMSIEFVKE